MKDQTADSGQQNADEARTAQQFYAVRVLIAQPVEYLDEDDEVQSGEPVCEWIVAPGSEGLIDTLEHACVCPSREWAERIRDLLNAEDQSLDGRLASLSADKEKT